MSMAGSVTHWIQGLKSGNECALAAVHERYWHLLVQQAREKLIGIPRCAGNEEDVAQEAFWSFYRSLKKGQFPRLNNRGDLLQILCVVATRKAASEIQYQYRQRRGGDRVEGESALDVFLDSSTGATGMACVRGDALPGQEDAEYREAMTELLRSEKETLRALFDGFLFRLPDTLREFAELYLAGSDVDEIADRTGSMVATVKRKTKLIQQQWREMAIEECPELADLEGLV
jgi:DNA-directed RNA polymerase specialized sigma24 family protein